MASTLSSSFLSLSTTLKPQHTQLFNFLQANLLQIQAAKLPTGVELPKEQPKLKRPFLGFTRTAEIWNSRACMIGLIGTFIVELVAFIRENSKAAVAPLLLVAGEKRESRAKPSASAELISDSNHGAADALFLRLLLYCRENKNPQIAMKRYDEMKLGERNVLTLNAKKGIVGGRVQSKNSSWDLHKRVSFRAGKDKESTNMAALRGIERDREVETYPRNIYDNDDHNEGREIEGRFIFMFQPNRTVKRWIEAERAAVEVGQVEMGSTDCQHFKVDCGPRSGPPILDSLYVIGHFCSVFKSVLSTGMLHGLLNIM
nr:light-harvesting complex-like protein OHP1, chloroplastic [Ipomoea batatas]